MHVVQVVICSSTITLALQAKSTDCDKLTASQRFCHSDFVTKREFMQDGFGDSTIVL